MIKLEAESGETMLDLCRTACLVAIGQKEDVDFHHSFGHGTVTVAVTVQDGTGIALMAYIRLTEGWDKAGEAEEL